MIAGERNAYAPTETDWTPEKVGLLRALWDEGESTAKIGKRLNVTKNAVIGKKHRLNLTPRPSPIRRRSNDALAKQPDAQPQPCVQAHAAPADASRKPKRQLKAGQKPADSLLLAIKHDPGQSQPKAVQKPADPLLLATKYDPDQKYDIDRRACCWPMGEPGTPSFRFCAALVSLGKPYCAEHAAVAYVKVTPRRGAALRQFATSQEDAAA